MRVILLKDVKNVGKKDDIVDVSDGYANNFLIKNKLAVPVSRKSLEILEKQKEDAKIAEDNKKKEAQKVAELLKDIVLDFTLQVGKDNRVFGSISFKQIEDELLAKHNIQIDKRKIVSKDKLDSLGIHVLKIELYKGVFGGIKVRISERK